MLIIAIPKSASTSLMATMHDVHKLEAKQITLPDLPPPKELRCLHFYHSDVREINRSLSLQFGSREMLFKQHLPPTGNNCEQLSGIRPIILTRNIDSIIASYWRAERRGIHTPRVEFQGCKSLDSWMVRSRETGLHDDLDWFNRGWEEFGRTNDALFIDFEEMIKEPNEVIRRIEGFWELSPSLKAIRFKKERYSRQFLPFLYLKKLKRYVEEKIK